MNVSSDRNPQLTEVLRASLNRIQDVIENARLRAGRQSDPAVEIVAVTKTFPADFILSACEAGISSIGENRVQEAEVKFAQIPPLPELTKRLIGHLQSNKIRRAIRIFNTIDSVDSLKLGQKISATAIEMKRVIPVLLQVNTSEDPAKYGIQPSDLDTLLALTEEPGIYVKGLMTIGKLTQDESQLRKAFRDLKLLRDELNRQLPQRKCLTHLSMGMSQDFEIAVEEGATMIRVGTILFGERSQ